MEYNSRVTNNCILPYTIYFSIKICFIDIFCSLPVFCNGGKFLGGGKNLPLVHANSSANRRPSIFPSTGGAAEPDYRVF